MNLRIAVVILNYNGEDFLRRFLPGVLQHSSIPTPGVAEIIVADNKSTDDSLALLRKEFPSVRVLVNDSNDGYAGGYNAALKQVDADYYVLLNSDVDVTPGWLEPLAAFMESHPDAAACQPKIKSFADPQAFEYAGASGGYMDQYGYPFCRGRLFGTLEKDRGQYDDAVEVFWASGACLFVRSSAFHSCGGFDASFFAHMEEIDLCWRMKRNGFRVYCCPQSTVYHVGGGTLKKENPQKTYLNFRNNLLMLKKNLPEKEYNRIRRMRLMLDALAALRFLAVLQGANFAAVLKAHIFMLRQKGESNAVSGSLTGIYKDSLVWQYYIQGKKVFSSLPGIREIV